MTVMISYSKKDWRLVEPVVDVLRSRKLPVWLDKEKIRSGADWRRALLTTPQRVRAFVPFLSANYIASDMCRMELFLARAAERPIFPVMLEECWDLMLQREETKNISMLFAARLKARTAVSLPLTKAEIIERLVTAIADRIHGKRKADNNAYISYPGSSAPFATRVRHALATRAIRPWVATLDCVIGDDWRRAQVKAMSKSRAHVVVISAEFLHKNEVLRTEVLMSESLGIETFGIVSDELDGNQRLENQVYTHLANGEDAFRRLIARQWYRPRDVSTILRRDVARAIKAPSSSRRN